MKALFSLLSFASLGVVQAGPYDYSDPRGRVQGSDYYYASPANNAPQTINIQLQSMRPDGEINHSSQRSDADILKSINDALQGSYFSKNFKVVHAQVNNGVVTITGFIESEDHRNEILDRIQKVGVRSIDDRLIVHVPNETPVEVKTEAAPAPSLQAKINDTIKNNNWSKNYSNINAQENNGTVIIWGVITSEADRKELKDRLQKLDGVRTIVDRLILQLPKETATPDAAPQPKAEAVPAVSAADRALNQKVRDALAGGFFTSGYESIQSTARKGVVSLNGSVASEKDRQIILNRIRRVDGVTNITDQITVEPKK